MHLFFCFIDVLAATVLISFSSSFFLLFILLLLFLSIFSSFSFIFSLSFFYLLLPSRVEKEKIKLET
jgi:hypothetical protein